MEPERCFFDMFPTKISVINKLNPNIIYDFKADNIIISLDNYIVGKIYIETTTVTKWYKFYDETNSQQITQFLIRKIITITRFKVKNCSSFYRRSTQTVGVNRHKCVNIVLESTNQ